MDLVATFTGVRREVTGREAGFSAARRTAERVERGVVVNDDIVGCVRGLGVGLKSEREREVVGDGSEG